MQTDAQLSRVEFGLDNALAGAVGPFPVSYLSLKRILFFF